MLQTGYLCSQQPRVRAQRHICDYAMTSGGVVVTWPARVLGLRFILCFFMNCALNVDLLHYYYIFIYFILIIYYTIIFNVWSLMFRWHSCKIILVSLKNICTFDTFCPFSKNKIGFYFFLFFSRILLAKNSCLITSSCRKLGFFWL